MNRVKDNPHILAIKSDKQELEKVENFLLQFYKKKNLPEETFNKVYLCISEAVINSIEHGNKNDKGKEVSIVLDCMKNDLKIEVRDEGDGFDYKNIANPTVRENRKKDTGRGIFIIQSLCNQVSFRNEGKCVEIKIELM
jgi:serine/threonine-protein kinase RsbW